MNLSYHLKIYRRDHLVLPVAMWALFVVIILIVHDDARLKNDMANAYLGFVVPLMAGILASSAVVDDPGLELQLAAPRAPWRILVERLVLLLGIIAVTAIVFQVCMVPLKVDVSSMGNLASRQLAWLLPSLALMGLSSVFALAFAQGTAGAVLVGFVWLLQLLLRDWFRTSAWARYLFLYMRARYATDPHLLANELSLLGLALVLTAAAGWLLKYEERYL